jgi:hypothetical protein
MKSVASHRTPHQQTPALRAELRARAFTDGIRRSSGASLSPAHGRPSSVKRRFRATGGGGHGQTSHSHREAIHKKHQTPKRRKTLSTQNMKLKPTTKILTGLLALSSAGYVHALDYVRIAGAATYRPAITKAIEDVLDTGYTAVFYGKTQWGPNASIYKGTLNTTGHPAVIIKTYWTGDLSGVVDLATVPNGKKLTQWINDSVVNAATPGVVTNGGNTTVWTQEGGTGSPVDGASTVSAASSTAAILGTTGSASTAYNALNNALSTGDLQDAGSPANAPAYGGLGIAPFQWTLGRYDTTYVTTGAPFTNITQQQALTLLQAGAVTLPYITGTTTNLRSSNDTDKWVLLVGRSEDAGARTVPFAEAGYGFGGAPFQFQLHFTNNQQQQIDGLPTGGQNTAGTSIAVVDKVFPWPASWPLNTETTINWNVLGHSGYNLTGDLANALSAINPVKASSIATSGSNTLLVSPFTTFPTTSWTAPSGTPAEYWFVGYNGTADASSTVGGTSLSYNGVAYTPAAVRNGSYSLWSYAHLYYLASQTSGNKLTALNLISDKVFLQDAVTDKNGNTYTYPTAENNAAVGILLNQATGNRPVLVYRAYEGQSISQY